MIYHAKLRMTKNMPNFQVISFKEWPKICSKCHCHFNIILFQGVLISRRNSIRPNLPQCKQDKILTQRTRKVDYISTAIDKVLQVIDVYPQLLRNNRYCWEGYQMTEIQTHKCKTRRSQLTKNWVLGNETNDVAKREKIPSSWYGHAGQCGPLFWFWLWLQRWQEMV